MVKIFDGKKEAESMLEKIKIEIKKNNLNLGLAVILVGENPVSQIYVKQKEIACQKVGINFRLFKFPVNIEFEDLKKEIIKIVRAVDNSGVIIQLPLPKDIPTQEILNLIPLEKDIDVLSEKSLGKFYNNQSSVLPPVVSGIKHFFEKYNINFKDKKIAILGSGRLVGKPTALWLTMQGATVSVLDEFTKNISEITQKADILISGTGKSKLVSDSLIKMGAIVVDVGTSVEAGKIGGDVDTKSILKKASIVSPVPGGIGPMTVGCLIENLFKLNQNKNEF